MSVNSRAGDPIPMKVLVCDANDGAAESLRRGLEGFAGVLPPVARVDSVSEARSEVRSGDYNVIFIDPLSLGLEAASSFVFEIRNALPEIVFAYTSIKPRLSGTGRRSTVAIAPGFLTTTRWTSRFRLALSLRSLRRSSGSARPI